jgi:hypothetical protein
MTVFPIRRRPVLSALTLSLMLAHGAPAHADERESLETLRQTTLGLIEALVQNGVLSREKAQALIAAAQASAQASAQAASPAPADATANGPAATVTTNAAGRTVQRVPYVSPAVRAQIRDEVKEEVLATAREERWGVPNAPTWANRIQIDGDFRYRWQRDRADDSNTSPFDYLAAEYNDVGRISRAPDFAAYSLDSAGTAYPTANTLHDRTRDRIRMRLGINAKVADEVAVGVRLASGNTTDRVSTNQTLGGSGDKTALLIDRAFVKIDPTEWLSLKAGRLPNPWFSTEMIWSDNLNFDGLAATASWWSEDGKWGPFATLGWFPVKEENPGVRGQRSLVGAQAGSQMDLSERTRLKFGLAYYRYYNIAGRDDSASYYTYTSGTTTTYAADPTTVGRYDYESGLRQKGNTVFETNPASSDLDPRWGLAYNFAPVALTASAEFAHFNPYSLLVSAEYVYNTAFDVGDFQRRAGAAFAGVNPGGRRDGYQLKLAFGALDVREAGQWQVSASYRHVGSDAVLDAFTDGDLGLGGTNLKGFTLGGAYGLYHNTSVSVRYLSASSIDPTISSLVPDSKYGVSSLQVDLNVRF